MKFLQQLVLTFILFSFFMPIVGSALRSNGINLNRDNPLGMLLMGSLCLLASILASRYAVEAREKNNKRKTNASVNASDVKGDAEHPAGG